MGKADRMLLPFPVAFSIADPLDEPLLVVLLIQDTRIIQEF